jgi:hypothetical protein
VKAYDEVWRTFSWKEHLLLELPYPHQAPYVSGDTLVLPVHEMKGVIRSFIMQSIPSPLRGVSGRQWQIDFDFFVEPFAIDATQDLLVAVPRHDSKKLVSSLVIFSSCASAHESHRIAYFCSRSLLVNHTPFQPTVVSFIWSLHDALFSGIANLK